MRRASSRVALLSNSIRLAQEASYPWNVPKPADIEPHPTCPNCWNASINQSDALWKPPVRKRFQSRSARRPSSRSCRTAFSPRSSRALNGPIPAAAAMKGRPKQRLNVANRRIAAVADRGLGRLNWVEMTRSESPRRMTGVDPLAETDDGPAPSMPALGALRFNPPGAGPLRCAGSAAPAGQVSPPSGGSIRGQSANRAPPPPSAPFATCRPAARIRTARRH